MYIIPKWGAEENQFGLGSSTCLPIGYTFYLTNWEPNYFSKIEVAYAKNGELCRTKSVPTHLKQAYPGHRIIDPIMTVKPI